MKIVIDSNILFSALIRDSLTRRLILDYEGLFLFPEFIFEEMEKHKNVLLNKSEMSEEDFFHLLQLILKKVTIVPNETLIPYRKEALEIVKNIDLDDVLFFACALAFSDSIIWSDDKKLKNQDKIKVMKTSEIVKII
tara:strand:+ start:428 stop:838 length:411 start_codon:yes stop_codon:yes gene_type:complete